VVGHGREEQDDISDCAPPLTSSLSPTMSRTGGTAGTRSSSIPIPRLSSTPRTNIESLISIPSSARPPPSLPRAGRPPARSFSHSASFPLHSSPPPNAAYQPRIIRPDPPHDALHPSSSSPDHRPPKRSASQSHSHPPSSSSALPSSLHSRVKPHSPHSFPRPSYLDHSALRHMLCTDIPSSASPKSYDSPLLESHSASRSRTRSPMSDSDDESVLGPLPSSKPPAPPSPAPSPNQLLRLPTRWSDEFRHHLLSVSSDGREITYQGDSSIPPFSYLLIVVRLISHLSPCIGTSYNTERDAAAVRTVHPIPPACGIYYYEVDIRSKGPKACVLSPRNLLLL
jgi:Ran-binding protein 9/10